MISSTINNEISNKIDLNWVFDNELINKSFIPILILKKINAELLYISLENISLET